MKRIFLTVASVVAFAASTYAVEPMSFGVKGNGGISNLGNVAENASKGKESNGVFNIGGGIGGYFEYAFHDMVGAGLDVAYAGGVVAKQHPKELRMIKMTHLLLNML